MEKENKIRDFDVIRNLKFNSNHRVVTCKMNLNKRRTIRKINDGFGRVKQKEVRYRNEINKIIKRGRRGAKIQEMWPK